MNFTWEMSWGIHSFGKMFSFIMFSCWQSWSSSWNSPICPLNFLEGNLILENSVLHGQGWNEIVCSHIMASPWIIPSSIRWNLFFVAYDLLIWGKERLRRKKGRKRLHLFLLSFLSCPLIKTLSLYRKLFYFSHCFSTVKNSYSFFS